MRWLIPLAFLPLLAAACGGNSSTPGGFLGQQPTDKDTGKDKVEEKVEGPATHNPREVVERAIQQHGGPVMLGRLRHFTRSEKGEISSFGTSVRATRDVIVSLPDKCRLNFELDAGTQKIAMNMAVGGDKGWRSGGGETKDLGKEEIEDLRGELLLNAARTLLPLQADGVELTALPVIKINKEPALGVKVASKGNAELKLWFDQKTGYLVKAERPGREAGLAVIREYYFSDFKELAGAKLPAKQVEHMNGRKVAEWSVTGCKTADGFPDSTFSKPQ